jgi:hypothetical protein
MFKLAAAIHNYFVVVPYMGRRLFPLEAQGRFSLRQSKALKFLGTFQAS